MLSRAKSQQCRILARVFERAGKAGYDGRRFVDGFMASKVSEDFFSAYDRLQWLGEGYVELEVGVFGGYLLELVGVEKLFQ